MAVLFNITHDANNLNEYDSTVTDSGDLSTGTPGLAGTTARMEALIDGVGAIYGQKNQTAPGSNQIRVRFYLDPNTLTMADNDAFYTLQVKASGAPWEILLAQLRYDDPDYGIYALGMDDEGNWDKSLGPYTITDAEHYVEVLIIRESGDGNNDGTLTLWIDGIQKGTLDTLDNWAAFALMSSFRLGATAGLDVGTSGTLYLDELKANDDGSEIGPVVAAGQPMALRTFGIPTGAGARNRPGGWN